MKGHFLSVAKAVLRFECGSWNSSLKLYLSRVEFELKITNGSWNDKLSDSNSEAFLKLKTNLEEEFNKAFCDEPDTVTDSCRTEVTGFSEGSINVFFLLIRIELKQLFRGVAQLLVGFIYTFWFFLSFISALLEWLVFFSGSCSLAHKYDLFSENIIVWLKFNQIPFCTKKKRFDYFFIKTWDWKKNQKIWFLLLSIK